MTADAALAALRRAVELSHQVAAAADGGNPTFAGDLATQRLEALRMAKSVLQRNQPEAAALVQEIVRLNDQALGAMEHRLRAKARDLDMAAVGRRAVEAYGGTRSPR